MNLLPRSVAMALFVVIAALVGLLTVPVWRGLQSESGAEKPATTAPTAPTTLVNATEAATARAVTFSQRAGLALAAIALLLTVGLMLMQAFRPTPTPAPAVSFTAARGEVVTLARLAETSVAQGAELTRERDVRRRAEEDAQLKQRLLAQSLDEKIRLGRDLHDGIIQSLYAAGLTLEAMRPLVKTNPDEAEARLEKVRESLNGAIRDVRTYLVGLAPENLRRAGFAQALTALVTELQAGREARFDIKIDDEAAALLAPEQSIEILQIAREAVSNAFRHGGATLVTLRLQKSDREVCLLVQDNGAGFDAATSRPGGHGLSNMQARAARLGATLRLTSQPREGTRVLATLPILPPPVT